MFAYLFKIIYPIFSLLKVLFQSLFSVAPKSGCRKVQPEKKFYPNKPKPPWVKKAINYIRTHQYLDGKTPAEVWNNIEIFTTYPKQKYWFSAWEGLLTGYYFKP